MKYGYKELKGKCKSCIGCNRLEALEFNGIERCEYYTEEEKDNGNKQQSKTELREKEN